VNIPPVVSQITYNCTGFCWNYYDADGDAQALVEIQIWTGAGGSGTIVWNPPVFAGTSLCQQYTGAPLAAGSYYVRIRANDGDDWGQWAEIQFTVCSLPTITSQPVANRGYYALTASSASYAATSLQIYVKDSASSFVAGPFPSGTVVKVKKSTTAGIGPASGPASVTINVRGDGQSYAVDPSGQVSAAVTCRSL
jgi:hypothetical protein